MRLEHCCLSQSTSTFLTEIAPDAPPRPPSACPVTSSAGDRSHPMTGSTPSPCAASGKIVSFMYLGLPTATLTLSSTPPPPAALSVTLVSRKDENTPRVQHTVHTRTKPGRSAVSASRQIVSRACVTLLENKNLGSLRGTDRIWNRFFGSNWVFFPAAPD